MTVEEIVQEAQGFVSRNGLAIALGTIGVIYTGIHLAMMKAAYGVLKDTGYFEEMGRIDQEMSGYFKK